MTDFIHMKNIIQGEVIRIRERRPLGQQPEILSNIIKFLSEQAMEVTVARNAVLDQIREASSRCDTAPSKQESDDE